MAIKMVDTTHSPDEVDMTKYFSKEPLASNPCNHAVPVYDAFQSPLYERFIFMVLPYLVPPGCMRFATVGEVVGCFDQLFEVILATIVFDRHSPHVRATGPSAHTS